jgi:lipooligosaccharide transport system permease protein
VAALPGTLRYAEREARIWSHLWRATVFSGTLSPILFLGAIGVGIGGLVEENTGTVQGLDYLSFVAPGLLVAFSVQRVAGASLWQVMAGHKWFGGFHAAVTTPLRPADVYSGWLTWQVTLAALNAVPFLAVAALLGGIRSPWAVFAVPAAALTTLAFAAALSAYSCTQDTDRNFAGILRLIILPLMLFSGTFFPLENLPAGIRPIAWATPMWHGVELSRGATTGSIGLASAALHVAFLVGFVALGVTWGVRTFTRRLAP